MHNFGEVEVRSRNAAVFRLANTGGGLLEIANVKKCCGVTVKLDKETLAPGESTSLTIVYYPRRAGSTFRKNIALLTNDPINAQTLLTITGKVLDTLVWTPHHLQFAAWSEEIACPDITVESLKGTPFAITGFAATGECLSADFDPAMKAEKFTLRPTVNMESLRDFSMRRGKIRVELEDADYDAIDLSFDVLPELEAIPAQILVFNATADTVISQSLQVRNNRAKVNNEEVPDEIDTVTTKKGSHVEVHRVTVGEKDCTLALKIWPRRSSPARSHATDELIIKMKNGQQLTVPIRVFYDT